MEKFRSQAIKLLQCEVSSEALLRCVTVRIYQKNEIYCLSGDVRLHWCYVLEGMVGAYQHIDPRPPYMHWAALQGQAFTGTKHEYSDSSADLDMTFLKYTRLAVVHLAELRRLMDEHPPIMQLINILRQRRSTISDLKLRVLSRPATERYRESLHQLPAVAASLNNHYLARYLNIDPKTLYRSRKIELKR
ncbi:Crp/Fnr family transcriptional regulator [Sphingobacterium luzhongxinii]|uniref:Crp/Fnr family transcriptional regulator n=1 Tax=Sphingobacterium luzhongxinii TaxID=2654181 RepID=UPI0013D94A97|nr:Crp/Fnr family transcriptional regulator [Sphingobacterium sp. xlx-73]